MSRFKLYEIIVLMAGVENHLLFFRMERVHVLLCFGVYCVMMLRKRESRGWTDHSHKSQVVKVSEGWKRQELVAIANGPTELW